MYDTTIVVPNTKIQYRHSVQNGWECTADGEHWHFTFRSMGEILQMHPSGIASGSTEQDDDREVWGETLDDEIPEDLYEMIASI